MLTSRILEIDGIFVGSLIQDCKRCERRFYAVHDAVKSFHNHILDRSGALSRQITQQFRRARASAASA
ncbi:hypothetical protein AA14337_1640 [Acetobacter malorum DSM 14337]|uniref:Uncharacterized protein n=1 Tax=Acetobacter malorum DSM 14337 TaxID=1307910 RepID=A0ABQ0PSV6_9PROT|nr:hypothetical protein [Acetobacter malorum]KXV04983.1 hypothetical protein AD930_15585 [Acetobacter malorum]GBQ80155.1 hypothetical protein AA14337_1640 [Acetobacter malorum DSM 14337]